MRKIPKYVVILSLDAVGETDLPFLKSLPHMKAFFEDAAYCDRVLSVYPSLTYPCHASIVTGLYPIHHGVINNVLFQPERHSPDWMWHRRHIRGTTFYEEAKKAGRRVAAFLWPVTAGNREIDYHVPEIFSNRRWDNQIFTSLRNGSKWFQLRLMLKYGRHLRGTDQPELDFFTFQSTLDTIRRYQPELVMSHLTDTDTIKHYSAERSQIKDTLKRHDRRLGELIRTLKETGIYDETTVILLGDHSQLEAEYVVYPNKFFSEKGWLKYNTKKKTVSKWKVISRDCDGAAYIYIHPRYKKKLTPVVGRFLEKVKDSGHYGIEKILTQQEAAAKGADPKCDFMLEAKEGYYFQNEADVRIHRPDRIDNGAKEMLATHGYDPEKEGFRTFFAMKGPGVAKGEFNGEMCLVDEAPTIAKLMGIPFPKVDGRVIEEMLSEDEEI